MRAEDEAVARGLEAWERLRSGRTWEDWMMVGKALEIGRDQCLTETHSNDVTDKRYRNAFSRWMDGHGFGDMDSGERTRLFECMQHRASIEAWRSVLTVSETLKLNHPQSVLRRWKLRSSEGHAATTPKRPGLREANIELHDTVDTLNKRIRNLEHSRDNVTEGRDWSWQDDPKDIATAWFRTNPTKATRAASIVLQLAKSTTAKPRSKKEELV